MKFKYGIGAILASTVLIAGCTTDKGEIKDYNEKIQQAFDEEKPVSSVGKKLNELEQKKQKLVKKINGKDQQAAKQTFEKIVDNVEERQKEFKKEVKELNDALKDKYKAHDNYANAYKNIMNKEKDLFEYGTRDQANQEEMNKKTEAVSKSYRTMDKSFNKYKDAMEKVNKEKQDVDNLN